MNDNTSPNLALAAVGLVLAACAYAQPLTINVKSGGSLEAARDAARSLPAEKRADGVVIVLAPVCRPGWLVEMECMAVKAQQKSDLPAF